MRVGKQMQFFGARVNLAKTLLYAINGGRDEITGKQVAPVGAAGRRRRRSTTTTSCAKFDTMMDWLAETYVDALNCIHYMHDKYAYERLEMALHDRESCAPWPAASPGCRWRPTRCRRSSTPRCTPVRDETRPGRRLR